MAINPDELNGIEATRQLLKQNPEIGILIVALFEEDTIPNNPWKETRRLRQSYLSEPPTLFCKDPDRCRPNCP